MAEARCGREYEARWQLSFGVSRPMGGGKGLRTDGDDARRRAERGGELDGALLTAGAGELPRDGLPHALIPRRGDVRGDPVALTAPSRMTRGGQVEDGGDREKNGARPRRRRPRPVARRARDEKMTGDPVATRARAMAKIVRPVQGPARAITLRLRSIARDVRPGTAGG